MPEKKQLPNIDTIIAIQEVANAFGAQIVPLVVSTYIFLQPNETNGGVLYFQLIIIILSNFLSAICITFLIFVHWKKGPEWWLKVSDKVFFLFLMLNYLIIPFINIAITLYFIFNPTINLKQKSIESYIVFFFVICFMRMVEYVTIVRRTVLLDARVFLQVREEEKNKTAEELKEALMAEGEEDRMKESMHHARKELFEEKACYMERIRGYGQGDIRIGEFLEVGEDIYSLGFISQIHNDIMDLHFDVISGELIDHKERGKEK